MVMRSIITSSLILVLVGLAIVYAQEPMIVAISDDVVLGSREPLIIRVQGSRIVALSYSIPSDVLIKVEETFREDFRSIITLTIINSTTHGRYVCELLFSSVETFNLTVVKYTYGGEARLRTYQCLGNITFKLVIPLVPKADSLSLVSERPVSISLWSVEPWGIAVYAVFISLFSLTAYLDLKDIKTRKAGRWSINDSIALMVRYMLHAFMMSFVAVALVTLGILIYSLVVASSIDLKLGNLIASLIMLIGLAVLYGVTRWRGWYELIDEED